MTGPARGSRASVPKRAPPEKSRRTEGLTLRAVDHQKPESERSSADHSGDYSAGNEASKPRAHGAPPCSVVWSAS